MRGRGGERLRGKLTEDLREIFGEDRQKDSRGKRMQKWQTILFHTEFTGRGLGESEC